MSREDGSSGRRAPRPRQGPCSQTRCRKDLGKVFARQIKPHLFWMARQIQRGSETGLSEAPDPVDGGAGTQHWSYRTTSRMFQKKAICRGHFTAPGRAHVRGAGGLRSPRAFMLREAPHVQRQLRARGSRCLKRRCPHPPQPHPLLLSRGKTTVYFPSPPHVKGPAFHSK